MTPQALARDIASRLDLASCSRILEPSCGEGAFLTAIIDRIHGAPAAPNEINLVGIEIDSALAERSRHLVSQHLEDAKRIHAEIHQADFFSAYLDRKVPAASAAGESPLRPGSFDLILGNPPFGGTFDPVLEDRLDARLGYRLGMKIKKETYAFFIVACVDLLRAGGRLAFICSDSLLTIPTMTGLRHLLMECGDVRLRDIDEFSNETTYPMVVLEFVKGHEHSHVAYNSVIVKTEDIRRTPNLSWRITPELAQLFSGPLLGNCFVASSGMTTGKNELFVREVNSSQQIVESLQVEMYDAPITVQYETERARLGRLPAKRRQMLEEAERQGKTERRLRVKQRREPLVVQLPDERYRPYNKANSRILYSEPTHYILWENEGEAVLTYKKTGNWYLRGVGGQPYFGREGITWQLVASRFIVRYLPPGYILDSGAPCAFLRKGVDRKELFLTLGWLLSPLANRILKTAINHTRNIQSKDFERMPYPWWVPADARAEIIASVSAMIEEAQSGRIWSWKDTPIRQVGEMFEFQSNALAAPANKWPTRNEGAMEDLFECAV